MHYIRFLRAPEVTRSSEQTRLHLVLTITTDLSDAYLSPPSPVTIQVHADSAFVAKLTWEAGKRVLKKVISLPRCWPATVGQICVGVDKASLCASSAVDIRHARGGQVMPAYYSLEEEVCLRKMLLEREVVFEEDVGESMARHIWDGGVVALSRLPDMFAGKNVLELGCGIGVLGCGVASLGVSRRVLLTDLPDAERLARANIGRLQTSTQVSYENLDWGHGCEGDFGPRVRETRWDVVMLSDCTYNPDSIPLLVGTLTALRALAAPDVRVFLATKNRHHEEAVALGLLEGEGWRVLKREEVGVPVLGGEEQTVELFVFDCP